MTEEPEADDAHIFDAQAGEENPGGIAPIPQGDSGILVPRPVNPSLMKTTQFGTTMVISFVQDSSIDELWLGTVREHLFELLGKSTCKTLIFNLDGIAFVPSGLLGMLLSCKKRGYEIGILAPSAEVMKVLNITKMDTFFTIIGSES